MRTRRIHSAPFATNNLTGVWFRAIQAHHWKSALSTLHSTPLKSRFSPGGFRILYLAEDPMLALFEVQALLGNPWQAGGVVPQPRGAWTTLSVSVRLHSVVDFCDRQQRQCVDTTIQELTGDWYGYSLRGLTTPVGGRGGPAPTQRLGDALHRYTDVEAIISISARLPDRRNLIVFPGHLQEKSEIRFDHPQSGRRFTIRRDPSGITETDGTMTEIYDDPEEE